MSVKVYNESLSGSRDKVEVDTSDPMDVFITTASGGAELKDSVPIMLGVGQVKAIRRQLKQWLIDNGHKKGANY